MIIDASIIVALGLGEPTADWALAALARSDRAALRMSWVNIAEAGLVLNRTSQEAGAMLEGMLAKAGIAPLDIEHEVIRVAIEARTRFPLNFGDCFAYAHAKLRAEPLITLDSDFLHTDLPDVLHPSRR